MTPLEPYTCNKCKPNTKKIVVELGQDMPPDLHETPNNANNQCEQLCQSTMLPSTHTMAEPARSRPPVLAPSPVVAEVRLKDSTISHSHKKTHNQASWTLAQTLSPPYMFPAHLNNLWEQSLDCGLITDCNHVSATGPLCRL